MRNALYLIPRQGGELLRNPHGKFSSTEARLVLPNNRINHWELKLRCCAGNWLHEPETPYRHCVPISNGTLFAMKIERVEGHHEATKALALSVAGAMVAMLMWNLMMLLFY
jgi:hypothetical protein